MGKIIRLTESDINKLLHKVITENYEIDEDFNSFINSDEFKKLKSDFMFGVRRTLGVENKQHLELLKLIHNILRVEYKNLIQNGEIPKKIKDIRIPKKGVLYANVFDKEIKVDVNAPEIIYDGKYLEIDSIFNETDTLYDSLKDLKIAIRKIQ